MATPEELRKPGPDPRLFYQWATCSRENIVTALTAFYKNLPHIDALLVHDAPPDGWPDITADSLARVGIYKTEEALELLRHLPYIEGSHPWITPETFPIDYRAVVATAGAARIPAWFQTLKDGTFHDFPPWVVQLTTSSDRDGDNYMLDTTDGTLTKFIITGTVCFEPIAEYADEDPRKWRDLWCDDRTYRVEKLLEKWKEKYQKSGLADVSQGRKETEAIRKTEFDFC
ncbi:hypothetical protein JX265_012917 [Neoarthrinium moseri]|uniref:Uncharacterized protein n=1 Tax=Neoarthrinium moseri TaxID=1658444 RepID=A0A9P9W9K7_9PEZI|nr:hypothetical protein JX265_012917 [Neoarthrinium moseri]